MVQNQLGEVCYSILNSVVFQCNDNTNIFGTNKCFLFSDTKQEALIHAKDVRYFSSLVPRPLYLVSVGLDSQFSPQLQDKIWEWPGNETRLSVCLWLVGVRELHI